MASLQKKSLDDPDETVDFEGVFASVVEVGGASISKNVYQPGTHCALGGRRMAGNHRAEESCQAHHTGVAIDGVIHIEMDDGSTMEVGRNEVYDVPPGHDGWVIGDQPFVAINWSGVRTWLPDSESGDRVVATLLFTDIVASTETAVRLGDAAWRELLDQHNNDVRNQLDRFRGREVTTTGDGFLAVFDGAARAIQAAVAIRDRARERDLEVRIGIHTGEVEVVGDDVRGAAVHEGARIASEAAAGEILISSTTRTLATGGGFLFHESHGHALKGFDGERTLFSVV